MCDRKNERIIPRADIIAFLGSEEMKTVHFVSEKLTAFMNELLQTRRSPQHLDSQYPIPFRDPNNLVSCKRVPNMRRQRKEKENEEDNFELEEQSGYLFSNFLSR